MVRSSWWVAALVVLLVNDHVLKAAWPGPVTGKLSDVAGLIVAPPLLALLLAPLSRRRDPGRTAVVVTGLGFAAIQVVPAATALADAAWDLVLPSTVTPDPTDLLALPALALPWRALTRRSPTPPEPHTHRRRPIDAALVLLGATACLATSSVEVVEEWRLGADDDGLVAGIARDGEVGTWYRSTDGGRTWVEGAPCGPGCRWGNDRPCGPLGCLRIDRGGIVAERADGRTGTVAVPANLEWLESRDADAWDAAPFERRRIEAGPGIVTDDVALVALGSAGILVSDDLGSWTPVAVGTATPASERWAALIGIEVVTLLLASLVATPILSRWVLAPLAPGPPDAGRITSVVVGGLLAGGICLLVAAITEDPRAALPLAFALPAAAWPTIAAGRPRGPGVLVPAALAAAGLLTGGSLVWLTAAGHVGALWRTTIVPTTIAGAAMAALVLRPWLGRREAQRELSPR